MRPHTSGHQLHFDSDETAIEGGKLPQHPIVSSVLFVSGEIGGPTLVTNQKLNGPLATDGWLVPPKKNRLVTFDAQYLHGAYINILLVPLSSLSSSSSPSFLTNQAVPITDLDAVRLASKINFFNLKMYDSIGVVPGRGFASRANDRRLTFMVGFWRDICAKSRGLDVAGPGQSFPAAEVSKYTWINEVVYDDSLEEISNVHISPSSGRTPVHISRVWQPIDDFIDSTEPSYIVKPASKLPDYNKCFQGF